MSTSLNTPTEPASRGAADVNYRLRTLRAAGDASTHQARYPGIPTGWGRWPTCACPRENRAADGSCS